MSVFDSYQDMRISQSTLCEGPLASEVGGQDATEHTEDALSVDNGLS